MAIKTSERNLKKCEEKIATLEQEVKDAENELRNLQELRKEIEEEAQRYKASLEPLQTHEKEMKAKSAKVKDELDAALKYVVILYFSIELILIFKSNLEKRTKFVPRRSTTIKRWKSSTGLSPPIATTLNTGRKK